MSFETLCFSMYSDISNRIMECWSLNKKSARVFASSVFPTPVLPRKRNDPRGFDSSVIPVRDRLMALETDSMACCCQMSFWESSVSIFLSFSHSDPMSFFNGMSVQWEMMLAMSSGMTCWWMKLSWLLFCCWVSSMSCFSMMGIFP